MREVVEHGLPLIGMAIEQDDGVADELGDRLSAGAGDERPEPGDLGVVELLHPARVVGDLDLGEPAEHVVDRVGPLLDRQLVEVGAHRHPGSLGRGTGGDGADLSIQHVVEPVAHLLAVGRQGRRASG